MLWLRAAGMALLVGDPSQPRKRMKGRVEAGVVERDGSIFSPPELAPPAAR